MWRPIKSAPKDGTIILLYDKDCHRVIYAAWDNYEMSSHNGFKGRGRKCWCVPFSHQDEQGGSEVIENPTHWMPLPKPPYKYEKNKEYLVIIDDDHNGIELSLKTHEELKPYKNYNSAWSTLKGVYELKKININRMKFKE